MTNSTLPDPIVIEAFRSLALSNGLKIASRDVPVQEWLDTKEYKSLHQEILFEEPASCGWSTPFITDPDDNGVDLESVLLDMGDRIGRIHNGSTRRPRSTTVSGFGHSPGDPLGQDYWRDATKAVPQLAARLKEITEPATPIESVLLHGNLSPNSFWFNRSVQAAILDEEQAAYGDPAFELAHMMAHLLLASVHRQSCILLTAAGSFHLGYARAITNLDKISVMYRAGPLTAALMLAFVHIESLSSHMATTSRDDVAAFATWWLDRRDYTIGQVRSALWTAIDMGFNDTLIDWRKEFGSVPLANR